MSGSERTARRPELSETDLIFNFYGWAGPSPESIAQAFIRPRQNLVILERFEAPDDLTKKAAFFIVSQTLYSDENYGYVNITKITSVGSGSYAVTLAKKINGGSIAETERKGKLWFLSDEGKATSRGVDRIGVDTSWEEYFVQKQQ